MSYQIAVIGGGPIGLYLSIKLAAKGENVHLYDKKKWPIDKVCGQGIMPSGHEALKKINLEFNDDDSYLFKKIIYINENQKIQGNLNTTAIGVERIVLSQKLYDRACSIDNLKLFSNSDIKKIHYNSVPPYSIEIKDELKSYDYIFICDGLNSYFRKELNNTIYRKNSSRMGARVHINQKPFGPFVQVFWRNNIEAYVTPVNKNKIEVSFLWDQSKIKFEKDIFNDLFNYFPTLKSSLKMNSIKKKNFKAYGPFKQISKKIKIGNIFFVGDSYQFLDGITGEGLSLGLKSADLICKKFDCFTWLDHIKIKIYYSNYNLWTQLALFLSKNEKLRFLVFYIVKKFPKIFDKILLLNDCKLFK